ncbi:hypothetical protein DB771_22930 [Burkholderia sp. AU29985]|nr:hypothetical protein XM57_05495 [Burkholderia cepacia]AYZ97196.1 hypothetical protein EGY28_19320 [Burkholderia dolosa]ETP66752.1 hypothetical protein BDSB_02020 [Burkholderia dolosa PC543]PRE42746.1 hypothetical protein C6P87_26040 [Burkholderia sp. AU12872]PUA74525.1 hypothetical protein DB771_22930 [Burkholderia sp. AU29985]
MQPIFGESAPMRGTRTNDTGLLPVTKIGEAASSSQSPGVPSNRRPRFERRLGQRARGPIFDRRTLLAIASR